MAMTKDLRDAFVSLNDAIAGLRTDLVARITKIEDRFLEHQREACTCGKSKDSSPKVSG